MTDWLHSEQIPTVVKGIWIFIVAMIIVSVTTGVFILVLRRKRTKRTARRKNLASIHRPLIMEFLMLDRESPDHQKTIAQWVDQHIKPVLQTYSEKNNFMATMLALHRDMDGELSDNLLELYQLTNLERHSRQKFRDKNWSTKIKGIHELTQFGVKDIAIPISKLANHKNGVLRREAQTSLITLLGFKGLDFFEDIRFPLSEWQQLILIEEMKKLDATHAPDFSKWFGLTNDTIVILSLRLTAALRQVGSVKAVEDLLNHHNVEVRIEAIKTLAALEASVLPSVVWDLYAQNHKSLQLEIVAASSLIGSPQDVPHLLKAIADDDFDLNLAAAESLYKLLPQEEFDTAINLLTEDKKVIKAHILDPMI